MEKEEILNSIKEYAKENYVPILQDISLDLILLILKLKRPNQILEVGTAIGYSAINFSKYLNGENSHILTIEKSKEMYNLAVKNVKNMGLQDKIEVVNADATTYLKTIDENKNSYDVIFIDAAKGQYPVFLESALRLIRKGGIIIADNVYFKGRVLSGYNEHRHRTATNRLKSYLKTVTEDETLDTTVFNVGDGVAVSIKK